MENLHQDLHRTNPCTSSTGTHKRTRIRFTLLLISFFVGFSQIGLSQLVEVEPNDRADNPYIVEGGPQVVIEGTIEGLQLMPDGTLATGPNYDPVDFVQFNGLDKHPFDSFVAVTRSNFDVFMAGLSPDGNIGVQIDNGFRGERIHGKLDGDALTFGVTGFALNGAVSFQRDIEDHTEQGQYSIELTLLNSVEPPPRTALNLVHRFHSGGVDATALHPDTGNLYSVEVTANNAWQLVEYAPDGDEVSRLTVSEGEPLHNIVPRPIGMTFRSNGNLLVADRGHRTVQEITTAGDIVDDGVQFPTSDWSLVSGLANAHDSENIWGIEQSLFALREFSPDGVELRSVDFSKIPIDTLDFTQGVGIHPRTGDFWIAGQDSTRTKTGLIQLSHSGEVLSAIDLEEVFGLVDAEGIEIDPISNQMFVGFDNGAEIAIFQLPTGVTGDFNANSELDVDDLNQLAAAVRDGSTLDWFDPNSDGHVDAADHRFWVTELANTYYGDSNLDGEFGSADLVQVYQSNKFEIDVDASWQDGDWNGDGRFDSSDLVMAFEDGGFERGPRAAVQSVPEPSAFVLFLGGLASLMTIRREQD